MKSVVHGADQRGQYLRRLRAIGRPDAGGPSPTQSQSDATPPGLRAEVELVDFGDFGDERRPVIISAEPLAQQMTFTNTPNVPRSAETGNSHWPAPPDGPVGTTILEVTPLDAQIVRIRMGSPAWLALPRDFGMLAPGALAQLTPPPPGAVREDEQQITWEGAGLTCTLMRDPFAFQLGPIRTALDDRDVHGLLCTPPPGFVAEGGSEAFWSWALTPDEHLYGLGERFTAIDHRGEHIALWNTDAWGTTTASSYKYVPFLHSSAGYGIFFHTPAPVDLRLGVASQRAASAQVGEPGLDAFLIFGDDTAAILRAYTRLTGTPTMPPRWAFGVWLSRCRYQTRAEVEAVATRARAEAIPADVLHIDPAWLAKPGLNCDFQVNASAFPDLPGMIQDLHARGFHISLWELPYVTIDSPLYADAAAQGFFLKDDQGMVIPADFSGPAPDGKLRAVVDFTNPAARSWWQDLHRPLLRAGVDVFKTDFGEGVPLAARAANGMTGYELRNLLPLLYNAAVHEVITAETGRPGMVWGRSGWAGTQRYPAQWGGDPKTDAWSMQSSLRGGLNMALSAPGIWAHDIGGFYGTPPPPDLYRRWAAFGLLSPLARAHGTTPREPWEFGERAMATFQRYARLRLRLHPYLYTTAWEAHALSLPMLRPLMLMFPRDPGVATIDDQYLLGHSLLVVPVFSADPGMVSRTFYLPSTAGDGRPGESWRRLTCDDEGAPMLGEVMRDGWHTEDCDDIAIFMRRDAVIPLRPLADHIDAADPEEITLLVGDRAAGTASIPVVWDHEERASHVLVRQGSEGTQRVEITGGTTVAWRVQLPGQRHGDATLLGRFAAGGGAME